MIFPKIQLTTAGKRLIAGSLLGETITFTQFKLGDGRPASLSPSEMGHPVISVPFSDFERGTASVMLTGPFDNADLHQGFNATELGVYAHGDDEVEVMYAYAYESENPAFIPAYSSTSFMQTKLNITVAIGDAQNVTAIIGNVMGFVTITEFEAHTEAANPHGITKTTVGLGLVPNVAPEDREIPLSTRVRLETLISNEALKTMLSKCAVAITAFIDHADNTNPHRTTYSDVGAASESHSHRAESIQGLSSFVESMVVFGNYTGNGWTGRTINLGYTPRAVLVVSAQAGMQGISSGLAVKNTNVIVSGAESAYHTMWDDKYCVLAVVNNGFKVNQYPISDIATNASGVTYNFIALK